MNPAGYWRLTIPVGPLRDSGLAELYELIDEMTAGDRAIAAHEEGLLNLDQADLGQPPGGSKAPDGPTLRMMLRRHFEALAATTHPKLG